MWAVTVIWLKYCWKWCKTPFNQSINSFLYFRHGRLRERDQILSIDGQPLDISHQEAIKILQRAGGLVELVVARGPIPQTAEETPAAHQDLTGQPSTDTTDMVVISELSCTSFTLTLDQTILSFNQPKEKSLLKTLIKWKKILVTSIFSFPTPSRT